MVAPAPRAPRRKPAAPLTHPSARPIPESARNAPLRRGERAGLSRVTTTATSYRSSVHEPREHGVPGGRRVDLRADADGTVLWCELYESDGSLRGCGPSLAGLSGRLLDLVRERLDHTPGDSPLYWRRERA